MRRAGVTRAWVFAAIVVGALAGANCGGGGGDDGGDNAARCAELAAEWETIVADLPTEGCDPTVGCWTYPQGSAWEICEPHPMIGATSFAVVPPPGGIRSRLAQLEAEFESRCECGAGGASCSVDRPPVTSECIDNRCVLDVGECNPPDPTCEDLIADVSAIAASLDRTCATVDDCHLLRYSVDSPGCDCAPVITDPCAGIPIATAALTPEVNGQLGWILGDFEALGCGDQGSGPCDCAAQEMFCSDEGLCTLGTANTCGGPPADASLADALP